MDKIKEKLKNHHYGVKTVSFKLEDLDEGSRQVKGYFASFDTLDSDNDVIRQGAFTKSIAERGPNSPGNRKIAHLRDHDFTHQIGNPIELFEDSKGLGFVSQMGRSTKGNDAFLDYQDGILREHSIGFNYISDKMDYIEPDKSAFDSELGHYEIREVKLWEGSGVTFGANEFTPTLEANKSILDSDYLLNLETEMNGLIYAIKNGRGTDERLENIELRFKQIQQKYRSLMELEPSKKETLKDESNEQKDLELQKQEQDRKNFYLNMIK